MTVVNIQTRMDRLVSRLLLPMREVSGMMETPAAGLSMREGEGCSDLVSVESFEERLRQVRGGRDEVGICLHPPPPNLCSPIH